MKLAVMQAYFFPYIGYFQLIDAADKMLIYEHVSFRKRSWITRNRILTKGSADPIFCNMPVAAPDHRKSIGETLINNGQNWRKSIIDALLYNYKKAPYFDEVFTLIEHLINNEEHSVHAYNSKVIIELCNFLEISTPIGDANGKYLDMEEELDQVAISNGLESKTQRVLNICESEGATHYINPIGGVELYDKEIFERHGLELSFIKTLPYTYKQFNGSFIPHLSVIDVLMNNGKSGTQELIKNYELI